MALCLVRTQVVPQILRIQIFEVQILVQIPTPAPIQTKTDEHQMVAPVFIALRAIWGQQQGGGSPFSLSPPPPLKLALMLRHIG